MKTTVLIPTLRRPADLRRCLGAIKRQNRPADEVIVTVRDTDEETQVFLAGADLRGLPLKMVTVCVPGVVAAMDAGLTQATGDILALTDDDTEPFPDWLERIEQHFYADPQIAGVGGRDWQAHEREGRHTVGIVQWFGRMIGNHHLGIGPARDVDLLKGANCAFRTELLRGVGFEKRLRGGGAQVHWELGVCLPLRNAGWRLVYDPQVQVDHHVAARHDDDQIHRGKFGVLPLQNAVNNETLLLLRYLPPGRRFAYLIFAFLIGTGMEPGLGQLVRLVLRGDRAPLSRFAATMQGRWQGILGYQAWCKEPLPRVPKPGDQKDTEKMGFHL